MHFSGADAVPADSDGREEFGGENPLPLAPKRRVAASETEKIMTCGLVLLFKSADDTLPPTHPLSGETS